MVIAGYDHLVNCIPSWERSASDPRKQFTKILLQYCSFDCPSLSLQMLISVIVSIPVQWLSLLRVILRAVALEEAALEMV